MTITGAATSELLEIRGIVTAGVWTDVTAYIDHRDPVRIRRGRSSRYDVMQPGTLDFTLQNSDGRFGDNPTSPYYPRWTEWLEVRYSVTKGATYQRFYGYVTAFQPDVAEGDMVQHVVKVTCVDVLGRLARRVSRCDFAERWLNTAQSSATDLFPFDPATAASTLTNIAGTGTATVIRPTTGVGAYSTEAPDEAAVMLDSSLVVTTANLVGPVIDIRTSVTSGSVNDIVIPFRTQDRTTAGGVDRWLALGRDLTGAVLWSVRLKDNGGQCDLNLYDSAGTFLSTLYFNFAPAGGTTDDQWFVLRLAYSGGTGVYLSRAVDNVLLASVGVAFDSRLTQVVALGGALPWRAPGKQGNCTAASFGCVAISAATGAGHAGYLRPLSTEPAQTRWSDANLYYNFGSAQFGTRSRSVALKRLTGRTAFDVIEELGRTAGALVIASRTANNSLLWYDADQLRATTVAATLDAVADIDASAGWVFQRGTDTKPTRATATWPGGQATYIDAVAETARGGQFDSSVETTAADEQGARDVAAAVVNGPTRSSLTQVGVDLAHSQTDLWATVMALKLEDRVRISSLPTDHYGVSYTDVYMLGHTEEYGQSYARHVFDTIPADDPVNGEFGTGDHSKFGASADGMTVTSGTAVGTTATGTIVVTTTIGAPFTVAAGAYPMILDWTGERVTITSAPASSVSPQTMTITARGVNGTVARSHSAGEAVDVALPLAFAR